MSRVNIEHGNNRMFAITTVETFFQKVQEDSAVFQDDITHSGKAMNCILSSYHLHEWVWALHIKKLSNLSIRGQMIKDKKSFIALLERDCQHFNTLQKLANGIKHLAPVHPTQKIAGYGMGPYGVGPFGAPYLLIDLGEDAGEKRYLTAHRMCREVVDFWNDFLKEISIALDIDEKTVESA